MFTSAKLGLPEWISRCHSPPVHFLYPHLQGVRKNASSVSQLLPKYNSLSIALNTHDGANGPQCCSIILDSKFKGRIELCSDIVGARTGERLRDSGALLVHASHPQSTTAADGAPGSGQWPSAAVSTAALYRPNGQSDLLI